MLSDKTPLFGKPIEDRAFWDKIRKSKILSYYTKKAKKTSQEEIPELPDDLYLEFSRNGNRRNYEKPYFKLCSNLKILVVAECLENKGRYIPAIQNLIKAICAQKTWVLPAHDRGLENFKQKQIDIDLFSSALGRYMALIDFLLGKKLSPEIRKLIKSNLDERIIKPFKDMVEGRRDANWWFYTTNNWNAVCLANVTGTALYSLDTPEDKALFIAASEKYSKNFLKGFAKDGYCTEGVGYWNYGFGNFLRLSLIIEKATNGKLDLMKNPQAVRATEYGNRIRISADISPAFADCGITASPAPLLLEMLEMKKTHKERYEVSRKTLRQTPLSELVILLSGELPLLIPEKQAEAPAAVRDYFDKAGVLICRPGKYKDCKTGVAVKAGHNNEHHNHNDIGSYVIVVDNTPVAIDPGSEVYTARTFSADRYKSKVLSSIGHPVPVIAGKLQQPGRQYSGTITKTDFTDAKDSVTIDIKKAYKCKTLKKLTRDLVYDRKANGAVTVSDTVEFTSPESFETAIITLGKIEKLDDGTLRITDKGKSLKVKIESDHYFTISTETIKEDMPGKRLPKRIGIKLKKDVTKAFVRISFMP